MNTICSEFGLRSIEAYDHEEKKYYMRAPVSQLYFLESTVFGICLIRNG